MTQLAVFMNAGYVKTPDELLASIAVQVQPSRNPKSTLLDMFCGEGIAAAEVAQLLNIQYTLGVEIDKERAAAARSRMSRVICEDALDGVIGSHGVFDMCFHNPPYMEHIGGDRTRYKRVEYAATLAVSPQSDVIMTSGASSGSSRPSPSSWSITIGRGRPGGFPHGPRCLPFQGGQPRAAAREARLPPRGRP